MSDPDSEPTPAAVPHDDRASESRALTRHEVGEILQRASEADSTTDSDGPTVTDLVEAAREVGLDPDVVRRSASLRSTPPSSGASWITGAPTRIAVTAKPVRVADDRTAVTEAARRLTGRAGEVLRDDEEAYVWRENHGLGRTTISLSRARLEVEADRAGHYLAHWFGGLLAWAAASSALPLAFGPFVTALLFFVTPVVLARPFWARSDAKSRQRLEALTMELLREAEGGPET